MANSTSFGQPNGNPSGRPLGSQNKITAEVFQIFKERGYRHPAIYCAEVYEDKTQPIERRDDLAKAALPWFPKLKLNPLPRILETPIEVPTFTSIDEAESFLAEIPQRVGRGELDFQSGLDLSTMVGNWISARHERLDYELKLANQGGGPEQTIHITGGLPALPGTNIIGLGGEPAPAVNGYSVNGHGPVIEHQPNDSIPSETPKVSRRDSEL